MVGAGGDSMAPMVASDKSPKTEAKIFEDPMTVRYG